MLEGALNADANLPVFINQFRPSFPVGMADQMPALQFMQISPMVRTFVPYIAFIDRKGMIRRQLTGGDLTDETQATVLRDIALKLVDEGAAAKPRPRRSSH